MGWQKVAILTDVKGPSDFPNDFSTHDIYAMNVLGEKLSEMNPPGSPRLLGAIATSYMLLLKHELLYHGSFTVRGVFTMRLKRGKGGKQKINVRFSKTLKLKLGILKGTTRTRIKGKTRLQRF